MGVTIKQKIMEIRIKVTFDFDAKVKSIQEKQMIITRLDWLTSPVVPSNDRKMKIFFNRMDQIWREK